MKNSRKASLLAVKRILKVTNENIDTQRHVWQKHCHFEVGEVQSFKALYLSDLIDLVKCFPTSFFTAVIGLDTAENGWSKFGRKTVVLVMNTGYQMTKRFRVIKGSQGLMGQESTATGLWAPTRAPISSRRARLMIAWRSIAPESRVWLTV